MFSLVHIRKFLRENFVLLMLFPLVSYFVSGCGDKKKEESPPQGCCGAQETIVTADISNSVGMLILENNGAASLAGFKNISLAENADTEESSLVKIKKDGEIESAISIAEDEVMMGPPKQLPKILTIAVSPHKDVYLHFERPFIYRAVDVAGDDPWDMSKGYQCQIFKIMGGTLDVLLETPPEADNLECIDNLRFIDSWQANRNSVFQFDDDSNVYYPASLPNGGGKMVVYKRTRDGSATTEVINSNICVNDFLITKNGGVFYTGSTSCNGGGGDAGGFFRYVAPDDGGVREIARDWWNFVFEPKAGNNATDSAVFFGPDPRSSTTASWNSACLFNFDPSAGTSAAESISDVITCGSDIWNWINVTRAEDIPTYGIGNDETNLTKKALWVAEMQNRCESEGQIFAGGGSQINAIKQDSLGNVYVIGKVRKKKAGAISCGLQIRGQHCVFDNAPYLVGDETYGTEVLCQEAGGLWKGSNGFCEGFPEFTSEADCEAAMHVWKFTNEGFHYNNVSSELCTDLDNAHREENIWDISAPEVAEIEAATKVVYNANWYNCEPVDGSNNGGDQWTDEYRALAIVDEDTKTLSMLSGTDEQAVQIWLVDDVPYYSTYNTTDGKYYLKRYSVTEQSSAVLHTNFEAYNIASGGSSATVYYDGLDFSNNSYSFGTMATTAPYKRTEKTGLTGTVKTIVILPQD